MVLRKIQKVLLPMLAILLFSFNSFAEIGYDGGFYITTKDKNFKFTMNGAIEPQVFYDTKIAAVNPNQVGRGPTQRIHQISFAINYMLMYFGAKVYDRIDFGIGFLHATNNGGDEATFLKVIGGTAGLSVIKDKLYLSGGQTGLPFDMASAMDGSGKLLSDWPVTTTRQDGIQKITVTRPSFGPAGGLGMRADGSISKVYYGIGILNGNEDNSTFNPGKRFSSGVRLGVKILGDEVPSMQSELKYLESPILTVNTGLMWQGKRWQKDDTDADVVQVNYMLSTTAGVAFRYKGLSITTEGYYRKMKIGQYYQIISDTRYKYTDIGYYGAVGYFVIPKSLELGVQGGQVIRQGPSNNSDQLGAGINWYIWDTNLKLQLGYMWTKTYDDLFGSDANNDHKLSLIFAAKF